MSNLAYLMIAVGFSVVLSLLVWALRYRKPKTFMSSIDEFQREMGALGGDLEAKPKKRGVRPEPIVPAPEQGDLARKLNEARRYQSGGDPESYLEEER